MQVIIWTQMWIPQSRWGKHRTLFSINNLQQIMSLSSRGSRTVICEFTDLSSSCLGLGMIWGWGSLYDVMARGGTPPCPPPPLCAAWRYCLLFQSAPSVGWFSPHALAVPEGVGTMLLLSCSRGHKSLQSSDTVCPKALIAVPLQRFAVSLGLCPGLTIASRLGSVLLRLYPRLWEWRWRCAVFLTGVFSV